MTEGQRLLLLSFLSLPLLIPLNALNSGGLGAEPPCAIDSIHDLLLTESTAPDRDMT